MTGRPVPAARKADRAPWSPRPASTHSSSVGCAFCDRLQHGPIVAAPHDGVEVGQVERVGAEGVAKAAGKGNRLRVGAQRAGQREVAIALATTGTNHTALHEVDYRYQLQGSAMRIFVFEYITGGGYAERPMVAELSCEGDLMLQALIRDLHAIPDVQVFTTRDTRLPDLAFDIEVLPVSSRAELLRAWSVAVAEADAVWPIAPETEGVLELLSGWVEMAGRRLLTSRANGVQVAGSKLATSRRLDAWGVAVVPTWRPMDLMPIGDGCWVLKPDRGVGCVGARLIRGQRMLADAVADLPGFEDWVLQPYLCGQAASLSLLVGNAGVELLGCNVAAMVVDLIRPRDGEPEARLHPRRVDVDLEQFHVA